MPQMTCAQFVELNRETVNHLFYECSFGMILNPFGLWFLAKEWTSRYAMYSVLGKLDAEIEILNYYLTLVKLTIWT